MSNWIKANEKLPKKFMNVLVLSDKGDYAISCVDNSGEFDEYPFYPDKIKYWQTLPIPPQTIENE